MSLTQQETLLSQRNSESEFQSLIHSSIGNVIMHTHVAKINLAFVNPIFINIHIPSSNDIKARTV